MDRSPVFISAETAEALFNWPDAIAALRTAYAQPPDSAANPRRTVASESDAWLRTLPAIPTGGRYFGAKLMGFSGSGSDPGVEYVVVLFDRETSTISAMLDANLITAYRTAATSAVALDLLAPAGKATLGVLGSGIEASMHARAFATVRELNRVIVFSPTEARRKAFASKLSEELAVPCEAVATPEAAIADSTVALAAARSYSEAPILFGHWLSPGTTVVSIGSTVPSQREVDTTVVDRADLIVCDVPDEVLGESGDMLEAQRAGIAVDHKTFSQQSHLRRAGGPPRSGALAYVQVGGRWLSGRSVERDGVDEGHRGRTGSTVTYPVHSQAPLTRVRVTREIRDCEVLRCGLTPGFARVAPRA